MVVVNNNGSVGSFCLSLCCWLSSVIFLAPKTGWWCDRESHLSLRVLWYLVSGQGYIKDRAFAPSELTPDMICKLDYDEY
jgi:hypothetical protein